MEEDFEVFIESFTEFLTCGYPPVNEVAEQISAIRAHWTTVTHKEKSKFLKEWREREMRKGLHYGSPVFEKATDNYLRNASKFITESNISKLATKYLGLTSQQIEGRDVFDVLKLWRDAMPYQGSKRVRVEIPK